MEAFQQRVVDEEVELTDKLTKLDAFLGGKIFMGLPEEDRRLLSEQANHMRCYAVVLQQRIARFAKPA